MASLYRPPSGPRCRSSGPLGASLILPPGVLVAHHVAQHVIVDALELAIAQLDAAGQPVDQHGEHLAAVGQLDHRLLGRAGREEVDRDLALGDALIAVLDPDLLELDALPD